MRGAALFLSAALILAPTAAATTEFEISFSIPASALNKAHQRTQDFIAFIQSPPSEAQPLETDPMPPPELVEAAVVKLKEEHEKRVAEQEAEEAAAKEAEEAAAREAASKKQEQVAKAEARKLAAVSEDGEGVLVEDVDDDDDDDDGLEVI